MGHLQRGQMRTAGAMFQRGTNKEDVSARLSRRCSGVTVVLAASMSSILTLKDSVFVLRKTLTVGRLDGAAWTSPR